MTRQHSAADCSATQCNAVSTVQSRSAVQHSDAKEAPARTSGCSWSTHLEHNQLQVRGTHGNGTTASPTLASSRCDSSQQGVVAWHRAPAWATVHGSALTLACLTRDRPAFFLSSITMPRSSSLFMVVSALCK